MTNGEIIKTIFPNEEMYEQTPTMTYYGMMRFDTEWWNAEYRDCEHCAKTYGTLGCCSTVSNKWVYSCKEGHEEYARGMRKFGSTTKNDLGVDAISRADARSLIVDIDIKHHTFGMSRKVFKDLYNGMDELPSVTLIRPKGRWIVQPSNEEQGERPFIWWKCSECGQVIFSETEYDRLEFHSFCGRCGAKMDAESNRNCATGK